MISCGRISGRRDSNRERVRDDPEACELRLIWLTSTVVSPQRREMYSAVSGSLMALNDIHDADSNHFDAASRPP